MGLKDLMGLDSLARIVTALPWYAEHRSEQSLLGLAQLFEAKAPAAALKARPTTRSPGSGQMHGASHTSDPESRHDLPPSGQAKMGW